MCVTRMRDGGGGASVSDGAAVSDRAAVVAIALSEAVAEVVAVTADVFAATEAAAEAAAVLCDAPVSPAVVGFVAAPEVALMALSAVHFAVASPPASSVRRRSKQRKPIRSWSSSVTDWHLAQGQPIVLSRIQLLGW